jgi:hypothetical protein
MNGGCNKCSELRSICSRLLLQRVEDIPLRSVQNSHSEESVNVLGLIFFYVSVRISVLPSYCFSQCPSTCRIFAASINRIRLRPPTHMVVQLHQRRGQEGVQVKRARLSRPGWCSVAHGVIMR